MNKPRITIASLDDVNYLLDGMVPYLKTLTSAFELMESLGLDATTGARAEARDDIERVTLIVLALLDEFRSLHETQCRNPETCGAEAGMAALEEVESSLMLSLRKIQREREQVESGEIQPGSGISPQSVLELLAGKQVERRAQKPASRPRESSGGDYTGFYA